jgi:hypothetical protein
LLLSWQRSIQDINPNAQGRSMFWAGPYPVYAPDDGSAFNHCYTIGNTVSRIIGMRLFDVGGSDDFTITLTP